MFSLHETEEPDQALSACLIDCAQYHAVNSRKLPDTARTAQPLSRKSIMSAQNSGNTGSEEVIALLKQDHQKITDLFTYFHRIRKGKDSNAKQLLAEVLCTELVIHAQLEREVLYPSLRRALDEPELLDEAEVEHRMAHQLISELELMDPEDELYDAELAVLCNYVSHHIHEEENRIFPKIKQATLDATVVQALKSRRNQLRNEFGMPDELEEGIEPEQSL
jgi:hemerythrin superfamily protein